MCTKLIVQCIAGTLLLSGCQIPLVEDSPMSIRGQLIDKQTRATVAGAVVVLLGNPSPTIDPSGWFEVARTQSDSDGIFWFAASPSTDELPHLTIELRSSDHVTLSYTPAGGSPRWVGLYLRRGMPVDLGRIELSRPELVKGTVVNRDGAPVPGATLRWLSEATLFDLGDWSSGIESETCDSEGAFELEVPPSARAILCSAPGYASLEQSLGSQAYDEAQTLVLKPAVVARGAILDPDGKPIAGAQIEIDEAIGVDSEPAEIRHMATTADDGSFAIDGLPALHRIAGTLRSDRHVARRFESTTVNSDLKLTLEHGRRIRFTVATSDTNPLPTTAFLSTPDLVDNLVYLRDGAFVTPVVRRSAGAGMLIVSGFAPRAIAWPAGTADVDLGTIALERGRSLEVQVQHANGAPFAGAAVNFDSNFAFPPWGVDLTFSGVERCAAFTDSDGRCALGGIIRTDGDLWVSAPNFPPIHRRVHTGVPNLPVDIVMSRSARVRLSFTRSAKLDDELPAAWELTSTRIFSWDCEPTILGTEIAWQLSGTTAVGEAHEIGLLAPGVDLQLELSQEEGEITIPVPALGPEEHREITIDLDTIDWSQTDAEELTLRESLLESLGDALTSDSDFPPLSIRVVDRSGVPQANVFAIAKDVSSDDTFATEADAVSDKSGVVTLRGLARAPLLVTLTSEAGVGLLRLARDHDREQQPTIALEPAILYRGRVVEGTDGAAPREPMSVELTGGEGPWSEYSREISTTRDGTLSLYAPPGPVTLTVTPADDRDEASFEAESAAHLPERIEFPAIGWALQLAPSAPLRARALSISIEAADDPDVTWSATDRVFPAQPIHVPLPTPGQYICTVRCGGHFPLTRRVTIEESAPSQAASKTHTVTLSLEALPEPRFLHVRAVREDGTPLPWIMLQAATERTNFGGFQNMHARDDWSYTNSEGMAAVPVHPGGEYQILAQAVGFGELQHPLTERELEQHQDPSDPLLLEFVAGGSLLVRLVDEDGTPRKGVVYLRHSISDGTEHDSTLGRYDESIPGYHFDRLGPRQYSIRVTDDFDLVLLAEKSVTIDAGSHVEVTIEVDESSISDDEAD